MQKFCENGWIFLSMFCPELQKLLKLIYDLTRKGRPFEWGKEQQDSFEEIKCRLILTCSFTYAKYNWQVSLVLRYKKICSWKCPVSNTEWQTQTDDSLCQQKITRSCKKLFYYWIRAMQISHKHSKFLSLVKESWLWCNCIPSITYIIKSKAEPATVRIRRLLELIRSYSFNLYYKKGKDMVLSNFLSRQSNDDSNPHEIIPISLQVIV